jgi:hypothetical protein
MGVILGAGAMLIIIVPLCTYTIIEERRVNREKVAELEEALNV